MDINDIQRSNVLGSVNQRSINKVSTNAGVAALNNGNLYRSAKTDGLEISPEGQEIRKLVKGEKSELLEFVKKNAPEVRESKIKDAKAKLESGFFDSPDVLDKLVDKLSSIL